MKNEKRMIWLAVNSNGDEVLSSNPEGFQRFSPELYHNGDLKERKKVISFTDTQMEYDHWIEYHNPKSTYRYGERPSWNYLPKGTISKITGKTLTWEDDPIKIEE